MSAKTVQRVLRPQNFIAVMGMGMLAVAGAGLVASSAGMSLPLLGEIISAAVGMAGGAKAVLSAA